MPTLKIQTQDGKTLRIEMPDDPTLDGAIAAVKGAGIDPKPFYDQIQQAIARPLHFGSNREKNYNNLSRTVPSDISEMINSAFEFPLESLDRSRALESAKKTRELTKGDSLSSGEIEDINSLVDAENTLQELIRFKSSGSTGKGVDTGPIIGARIPLPLVPASLTKGGDRAEFRRKVLSFLNPLRKSITGAQAGEKELSKFILPAVPDESDQDLDFYSKSFGTLSEIERRKRDMIENLRRSGKDITGFEELVQGNPEDIINDLIKSLSGDTGKYSLPIIDPDRINKVLGLKSLNNGSSEQQKRQQLLRLAEEKGL